MEKGEPGIQMNENTRHIHKQSGILTGMNFENRYVVGEKESTAHGNAAIFLLRWVVQLQP